MIDCLFASIIKLTKENIKFIDAKIGISYARKSYRFVENAYPIKKGIFSRKKAKIEYQMTLDQKIRGYSLEKKKYIKK